MTLQEMRQKPTLTYNFLTYLSIHISFPSNPNDFQVAEHLWLSIHRWISESIRNSLKWQQDEGI